mmetsp:Transcript_34302/g.53294  ORF Transcript_34302/g.53294 Transcript_34302/m.53294 type:complete len:204 (+) Transcript_34302:1672-2283(+)
MISQRRKRPTGSGLQILQSSWRLFVTMSIPGASIGSVCMKTMKATLVRRRLYQSGTVVRGAQHFSRHITSPCIIASMLHEISLILGICLKKQAIPMSTFRSFITESSRSWVCVDFGLARLRRPTNFFKTCACTTKSENCWHREFHIKRTSTRQSNRSETRGCGCCHITCTSTRKFWKLRSAFVRCSSRYQIWPWRISTPTRNA